MTLRQEIGEGHIRSNNGDGIVTGKKPGQSGLSRKSGANKWESWGKDGLLEKRRKEQEKDRDSSGKKKKASP